MLTGRLPSNRVRVVPHILVLAVLGAALAVTYPEVSAFAVLTGLLAACALGVATWLVSVIKRDVSIVDSLWSVLIVTAAGTYAFALQAAGPRAVWLIPIAGFWALRLCGYITWRNWGEPEDYRYQQIRARNDPNFTFKSLYLVFTLQAVLAWIVAAPLAAALPAAPVGCAEATAPLEARSKPAKK